jgi:hypothetical protein
VDVLALACIALVLVVPAVLLVGALVVRAAVRLANQRLWTHTKPARVVASDDAEDEFAVLYVASTRVTAIRPLSFEHALGLSFVVRLIQACGTLVYVFFVKDARVRGLDSLSLAGFLALLSFVVTACLCAVLLPTTFGRACLVVLFDFLITAALVVALALPLLILFG